MRTALTLGILTAAIGGCGWYTNIPAQITVKSLQPASVEYSTTTPSGGSATTTAKVTQPVVTLEGEPGSVGVTYTEVSIIYHQPDGGGTGQKGTVPSSINGGKPVLTAQNIRVDSSAMRTSAASGSVDMVGMDPSAAANQKQPLALGVTEWTAPVVTQDVIAFGKPTGGNTPGQIYAEIVLDGVDDAHFHSTLTLDIPITFINDTP
ncbi:MAG: hypothetical protein KGR26_02665 [Cyanobacteria bacterium REEB65]|nr:hypothetical protein [Cyanobacteria bacterium REEB65]